MIHGKPYNPHFHGVVDLTHRTIINCLISKYLEDVNNFKLKLVLKDVVNNLNNNLFKNNICKITSVLLKKLILILGIKY